MKLLQTSMGHSTYKLTADLYANHPFPLAPRHALYGKGSL